MNYQHHNRGVSAETIYAQRVALVDALHVDTENDRKVLERAKQLFIEESRNAGEILLLTGASMSGRAETIRQVARAPWLASTSDPDGRKHQPYIEIDARAQARADHWSIVDALSGVAEGPKNSGVRVQNERNRLHHAITGIKERAHRLIAIKNAEHMLQGKDVNALNEMAGRLALVAYETKASFMLTGNEGLLAFFRTRLDMVGSVSHFPMQPVTGRAEIIAMVEAFEMAGGLPANPKLREDALVDAILDLTQGQRGRVAHLLREGVKGAIFDDVDVVSLEHLIKVVDRTVLAIGENPLLRYL